MAAGCAALRLLYGGEAYQRLEAVAALLADGLRAAAAEAGVQVQLARVGSMLTVFFTATPVVDYETARTADTARYAAFFQHMLERGIYLPPSQFELWFVSLAHSEADVEATVEAARASLAALT
jgi:glutamate-1-semialdehyde 2,1-aminomutase